MQSISPRSTEKITSLPIRYEIISDSDVNTILYSFCTLFISVFNSYCIHHRLRVNGKPILYEIISDSFESDIMQTGSKISNKMECFMHSLHFF